MRRPLSLTAPLLAVLASSLILAACGTGDSDDDDAAGGGASSGAVIGGPGVDVAAKTIRIGDINALTGPASALGKPVAAGHRAFFKSLNASGGIDGWKVRLTIKDSGYSAPAARPDLSRDPQRRRAAEFLRQPADEGDPGAAGQGQARDDARLV